jgi:hypothetical protein
MTSDPIAPRPALDQEAIRTHLRTAHRACTPIALWTAIADVPLLLAEINRLLALVTRARTEFANLLAAARATLAAQQDGEPDPLSYLRDELTAHQPIPPAHAHAEDDR